MKRPAFQFYPADWRKDAALQSCSIAAQGLWINALCIAHECDPYGHLTVNGKPMTGAQIGRLMGLAAKECEKLLGELESAGVLARTDEGAIFSRRMVRDEDIRNRRANGGNEGAEHGAKGAEHGKKGGRPPKGRGVIYPPSEPPPSSSSSSSTSITPTDVGVTRAGEACKAMRGAGMADVNPSHPKLTALLDAGLSVAELAEAAAHAVQNGKPFAYALATAEGRRRDSATSPLPAAGTGETAYQRSMRERVAEFSPGIARRAPNERPLPETFDMELPDVLAIGRN